MTEQTPTSRIEALKDILHVKTGICTRETDNLQFVSPYSHPDYFFSKCFPVEFPYGRGCPSDKHSVINNSKKHTAAMLMRGGHPDGRRLQRNPSYIFVSYALEMSKRIGGVTFQAQRSHLDDEPTESDVEPTVAEMTEVCQFLKENNLSDLEGESFHIRSAASSTTVASEDVGKTIKKLIARMVPYSESLKGTPMYIANEKNKLMSMITSPIINAEGSWRWFFTQAPADLYDPLLFNICADDLPINEILLIKNSLEAADMKLQADIDNALDSRIATIIQPPVAQDSSAEKDIQACIDLSLARTEPAVVLCHNCPFNAEARKEVVRSNML